MQKLNLSAEDQQTLSMFVSFMEEEKGNLYTLFLQDSVTVLAEQSVGNVQEGKDPSPSVGANTDNNSGATSSLLNETELAVRDDVNAGQDITSQVHTHDFGTEWHWDAEYHWLECPCGAKSNRAVHQYKEVDDSQEECAICGYKCGESSEITKDVEEVKDEHNEKNIYSILLIVIFSVGCLIAIGFVVLRKKRETT